MKRLQWSEPTSYRRALARQQSREKPWLSVIYAAGVFGAILGFRAIDGWFQLNPNRPGWVVAIGLAAGGAFFFAYFLPWMVLLLPNSLVILSEKGVNNNVIGGGVFGVDVKVRFWSWNRIAEAAIGATEVDGQRFRTFILQDSGGNSLAALGLNEPPTLAEIREYLQSHGLELNESAA